VLEDGDTVRMGPIVLTAHITGGHTRGCTSWSFPDLEGYRAYIDSGAARFRRRVVH
jgi:metallo-beta-lactamase class B